MKSEVLSLYSASFDKDTQGYIDVSRFWKFTFELLHQLTHITC